MRIVLIEPSRYPQVREADVLPLVEAARRKEVKVYTISNRAIGFVPFVGPGTSDGNINLVATAIARRAGSCPPDEVLAGPMVLVGMDNDKCATDLTDDQIKIIRRVSLMTCAKPEEN